MTFEKIMTIFKEHLEKDENIEIIKVKKGYLHLYWDKVSKDYNVNLITTLNELFNMLLDDVSAYYKFESDLSFNSESEQEYFIKSLQEEFYNKYKHFNK